MSERTYKIADAIMDSGIEEYRSINLASADAIEEYALNGMGISISSEEAEAILKACREYLALVEEDGSGQVAWDSTIAKLVDWEEDTENSMTAQEIIDLLKDEIQDAESREEWQKRALEALEDGQALLALGIGDDDQEAVEEAYDNIKKGQF